MCCTFSEKVRKLSDNREQRMSYNQVDQRFLVEEKQDQELKMYV